jgi:hypothetical protein
MCTKKEELDVELMKIWDNVHDGGGRHKERSAVSYRRGSDATLPVVFLI